MMEKLCLKFFFVSYKPFNHHLKKGASDPTFCRVLKLFWLTLRKNSSLFQIFKTGSQCCLDSMLILKYIKPPKNHCGSDILKYQLARNNHNNFMKVFFIMKILKYGLVLTNKLKM